MFKKGISGKHKNTNTNKKYMKVKVNRTVNKEPINLTKDERQGLKKLKDRIKSGELVITSTDKSSRFAILNRQQYLNSGKVHTDMDIKIKWEDVKYLQMQVNSHMWWYTNIVGYCKDTDQARMSTNVQGTPMEIPDMVLLIKDHKRWSPGDSGPVPSRPVVSGSRGVNTHLSEWIAEVMEPISNDMPSGNFN